MGMGDTVRNGHEQCVSYFFMYYRGCLYKGVAILDATGTNLQQKLLF
jgi:hypothetical protein